MTDDDAADEHLTDEHLRVLSIDHRMPLIHLAEKTGAPLARVARFKELVVDACLAVAAGRPGYGMFLDGGQGAAALDKAMAELRFDAAAGAIYRFVWDTFCDWYLELLKPLLNAAEGEEQAGEPRPSTSSGPEARSTIA